MASCDVVSRCSRKYLWLTLFVSVVYTVFVYTEETPPKQLLISDLHGTMGSSAVWYFLNDMVLKPMASNKVGVTAQADVAPPAVKEISAGDLEKALYERMQKEDKLLERSYELQDFVNALIGDEDVVSPDVPVFVVTGGPVLSEQTRMKEVPELHKANVSKRKTDNLVSAYRTYLGYVFGVKADNVVEVKDVTIQLKMKDEFASECRLKPIPGLFIKKGTKRDGLFSDHWDQTLPRDVVVVSPTDAGYGPSKRSIFFRILEILMRHYNKSKEGEEGEDGGEKTAHQQFNVITIGNYDVDIVLKSKEESVEMYGFDNELGHFLERGRVSPEPVKSIHQRFCVENQNVALNSHWDHLTTNTAILLPRQDFINVSQESREMLKDVTIVFQQIDQALKQLKGEACLMLADAQPSIEGAKKMWTEMSEKTDENFGLEWVNKRRVLSMQMTSNAVVASSGLPVILLAKDESDKRFLAKVFGVNDADILICEDIATDMGLSSNLDGSFPGYRIQRDTKQPLTNQRLQRDIYTMFVDDDGERKAQAVQLVRLLASQILNYPTFNHVKVNEIGTGVTMKDVTDSAANNSDHSQDGGAINAADKISISVREVKNLMESTQSPMALHLRAGELKLYSYPVSLKQTSGAVAGMLKRCAGGGSATKNGKCRL
eukprot:GHVS01076309.1.p1 GENE.GHVS01076309.1~~GHVS01076309.1.p1  ORF type:complete len:659 (-),score=102.50 GHVS01076309.1:331-2307(-)